jgi:hypothetical protein
MTTTTTQTSGSFEELDYRESDGIEVSLLWSRATNDLSVLVADTKTDELLELRIQPHEAMDAFRHPFAYSASHRVEAADDELAGCSHGSCPVA